MKTICTCFVSIIFLLFALPALSQLPSYTITHPLNVVSHAIGDNGSRSFNITIVNGSFATLDFTYEPGPEVTNVSFEFFHNGISFWNGPASTDMLISDPGGSFMVDDVITVTETYTVWSCTGDIASESYYTIKCNTSCSPTIFSFPEFNMKIKVVNDNTSLTMQLLNWTPLTDCGSNPFNFTFRISNGANGVSVLDGLKRLVSIGMNFNMNVVNTDQMTVQINGQNHPVGSVLADDFVFLGGNTFRINFENLETDPLYDPDGTGPIRYYSDSDSESWIIEEGQVIDVVIGNLTIDCDYIGGFDHENPLWIFSKYGTTPPNDSPPGVTYNRMCVTGPNIPAYSGDLFYGPPTPPAFCLLGSTDVFPNQIIPISYYNFSTHNPWRFNRFYNQNFLQEAVFDCDPDLPVEAKITLPSPYSMSGTTVTYTDVLGNQSVLLFTTAHDSLSGTDTITVAGVQVGGRLDFNVILDNCIFNTGGLDVIEVYLNAICNANCGCGRVFGHAEAPLYRHCQGYCNSPVGTDQGTFEFNRTTFGWTDNTMTTQSDASNAMEDRVYMCDQIHSECSGAVDGNQLCEISQLYFELWTPTGDANARVFQFTSGTITVSQGLQQQTYIPSAMYFDDKILLIIPNADFFGQNLYDAIVGQGIFDLDFEGVFTVTQTNPTLSPLFYNMPQVRAQFRVIGTRPSTPTGECPSGCCGSADHESCDSWGDRMLVLVTGIAESVGFGHQTNLCDACVERMAIITSVTGGIPLGDDFPGEFRPVTQWPQVISLTPSAGLSVSHALYVRFNDYNGLQSASFDVCVQGNNLTGLELGSNPYLANGCLGTLSTAPLNDILPANFNACSGWPILDKNFSNRQELYVYFNQDCPADQSSCVVDFPLIRNAYTSNTVCRNVRPPSTVNTTIVNNDNITLNVTGGNPISIFSTDILVDAIYTFSNATHPSASNFWLYIAQDPNNPSPGEIIVQGLTNNGFPLSQNAAGYWQLGDLLRNVGQNLQFDLTYICPPYNELGSTYDQLGIVLYYGYSCEEYPDTPPSSSNLGDFCFIKSSNMRFDIFHSGLDLNIIQTPGQTVSACDEHIYEIEVKSIEEADILEPKFTYSTLSNLELLLETGSSFLTINCQGNIETIDLENYPPVNISPGVYQWDLASSGLLSPLGNVIPGVGTSANCSLRFYLKFISPCDEAGNDTITFFSSGTDLCGLPITDFGEGDPQNHIFTITPITDVFEVDYNYPSALSCEENNLVQVTITNDDTSQDAILNYCLTLPDNFDIQNTMPNAPVETNPNPGFAMYCWSFSQPQQTVSISYEIVVPASYCGNVDISSFASLVIGECGEDCALMHTETLYACCQSCSADFAITQTSDCCYLIEDLTPDVMPCPQGGFGIFRADSSWVATYQGVTSFEHCFEENGNYLICSTVCCADSSLDKVCQLITVTGCNDECEGFEITALNDGCDYTFTAVHPSVNSPTYGWWVGYNGIVEWNNTGVLNHTYPPGYYQDVCYTIFFNDSITNEPIECKVCMPIEVNCEPDCDLFDIAHTNKGDCKHGFDAVLPPNFNGTNVSYCWYMDYNNTTLCPAGSSVGFTYPTGTYTICYEITYSDPNYSEPVTCKVCREYEFKCDSDKPEEFCYIIERKDKLDEGKVITPLKTGGYIVAGEMHGNDTNLDLYFTNVKDDFTSDYNYLLDEVISERSDIGTVYSTLEIGSNIYILGKSAKWDATNADVIIACLDAVSQNVLWAKRYGTAGMDIGTKLLNIGQNKIVVVGHTNYYNLSPDNYDLFTMLVDLTGNLADVAVYIPGEKNANEVSTDAVILPDEHGQFLIAGYNVNTNGMRDMIALKVNYDLTPASSLVFIGDENDQWANGVTVGGGYIYLVGASGLIKYKDYHIYVAELKASDLSQTNASRIFTPDFKNSVANKVIYTDKRLTLVGDLYTTKSDMDVLRGTVLHLVCDDKDGKHLDIDWSMKTFEENNVRFNHLSNYKDSRLLVTGTFSTAANDNDIFVVNMNAKDGEGCCVEPLTFEKKALNKTSTVNVSTQRPSIEVKSYGVPSTYFELKEICKKDGKDAQPDATASVKMLLTDFNVFPNPNAGYFSVQLSNKEDAFKSVTIFDMAGRKVFDRNYSNEKSGMSYLEINADELTNGVYLLQVEGLYGLSTKLISISK